MRYVMTRFFLRKGGCRKGPTAPIALHPSISSADERRGSRLADSITLTGEPRVLRAFEGGEGGEGDEGGEGGSMDACARDSASLGDESGESSSVRLSATS